MAPLHPTKKSIITIHYDYIIGNEVPHFVGKELMKKDESFATNCLEFFCFDSPVKEVIVLKADGSFISRNQLLTKLGIYISKEIRMTHNIHKMLLADSFHFRNIHYFKNYGLELPEAIGNLVWRSQKSYAELCGKECAILDEGLENNIKFPDIGIVMDKATIACIPAYNEHKTPPQPIYGQGLDIDKFNKCCNELADIVDKNKFKRVPEQEPKRKVTTLTLPSGKTIELKAPTKESIDLLWNKFEGISEGISEEDKTNIQKVMERRGGKTMENEKIIEILESFKLPHTDKKQLPPIDLEKMGFVSNWKLDTIATLQMIQAYIIDNYSHIKNTNIYDSKEIENIVLHWNKDMMSDKDEDGNLQIEIDVWIKLDIGMLICNRKPLHTFAEYIESIINQIKSL